jgi:hypothetical protein
MPERMQWVFCDPCGCPFGVMEGGQIESEAGAIFEFYGQPDAIRNALARGVTAERMSHDRYVRLFLPKMRSDYVCPHGEVTSNAWGHTDPSGR